MTKKSPVLIGLTSICGRERALERTLQSLSSQILPLDGRRVELHLFLSNHPHLLDPGFKSIPAFLYRQQLLNRLLGRLSFSIHWVPNWGPYRKILPLLDLLTLGDIEEDPFIITADDDTIYPSTWLQELVTAQERWNCVVAFRGRQIVLRDGEFTPYNQWIVNSKRLLSPSILTVPTGKDGVCYRLSHIDWRVHNISKALLIAGNADDLWLKTHTLLTQTPCVLLHSHLHEQFPELSYSGKTIRQGILGQDIGPTLFLNVNKAGGNDIAWNRCLRYLRMYTRSGFP